MTPRIVRSADVAAQPWRNGGGTTRELLAWPGADWRVRVSVADVAADGPFSAFPGVRRWFAVLDGAGVALTIDGRAQRVARGDAPLAFDGAATTQCRLLDGPTRDLNLMLRGAAGGLLAAADGAAWQPAGAACGLYAAVAGRCVADGHSIELPADALLWFERAPARLAFHAARTAGTIGWWLEATPHDAGATA